MMQHLTRREQGADGQWRTVCPCGWTSEPAAHRDALGWACAMAEALKREQAIQAEMDMQIVAEAEGFAFTRGELAEAFRRVENKQNWKYPIDAMLAGELTHRECAAIRQAVIFFAGCEAMFTKVRGNGYRVQAVGYYAAIGS